MMLSADVIFDRLLRDGYAVSSVSVQGDLAVVNLDDGKEVEGRDLRDIQDAIDG